MTYIKPWVSDQAFLPADECLVLDVRQVVDISLQFKMSRILFHLVALVDAKQRSSWRLTEGHAVVRGECLSGIWLSSNSCILLSKCLMLYWDTDPTASWWLELASDSFVLVLNEAWDQS